MLKVIFVVTVAFMNPPSMRDSHTKEFDTMEQCYAHAFKIAEQYTKVINEEFPDAAVFRCNQGEDRRIVIQW